MKGRMMLLAMTFTLCGGPVAQSGVFELRDVGHRDRWDPVDVLPLFDSSHSQTYYPHPHWHGRSHRAWKKWVRAGRPGRGPKGACR